MIKLLIPIIATCSFKADPIKLAAVSKTSQTEIERELNIRPKLTGEYKAVAYIYAVSNKYVWIHANTPISGPIEYFKLTKVLETKCQPLLKEAR